MKAPLLLVAALTPGLALAYPTVDRGAFEGGSSTSDLAVSDDGRYIATSQRSDGGGLAIWDRVAPREVPTLAEVCEAVSVVWTTHTTRGDAFYVGCSNNEVVRVGLDTSTVPPGASVGDPIAVGIEGDTIVSLAWTEGDGVVHALANSGTFTVLHTIDIASDVVDAEVGMPGSTPGVGVDLVVEPLSGNGNVLGLQSDGGLVWASRSGGTYSPTDSPILTGMTPTALAVDPEDTSDLLLFAIASTGEIWAGDVNSPSQIPEVWTDGLSSPQRLAFGPDATTPVVYVANASGQMRVFDVSGNELDLIELESTGSPVAIEAAPDNAETVYVAGGDGTVRVVSERPWVTSMEVSPESVGTGDTFTITFTVDSDCAWDLRLEAGIDEDGGTSLQEGSADADEEIEVALDASVLDREGENRLSLFVSNPSTLDVGVDSATITLDTVPEVVTGFTVSPGDARLVAGWTSTDEEDIDKYLIYVSDAAFTSDTETLPALTVTDADGNTIEYPTEVEAGDPSSSHSVELQGLTNGATYWVAVQAIDEAGNESSLSAVVSGTPELACGLVECYGDTGCTCSSTPSEPAHLAWILLGALGIVARRRL